MLALAFADGVIDPDFATSPEELQTIEVPQHKKSLKIPWKSDAINQPIFRTAEFMNRVFVTSPEKPLDNRTASKWNIDLGKSAGLELPFWFYSIRRGAGTMLDR